MKRWFKFYVRLIGFCAGIFIKVSRYHPDIRLRAKLLATLRSLLAAIEGEKLIKTTADSNRIYQTYDDREVREEESISELRIGDVVVKMSLGERRRRHLVYLYEEIDHLLKLQATVRLLEVGCGNLLNAKEIVARFGDKVEYHGLDISPNRIANGLKHFAEVLDPDRLYSMSITQQTAFSDNQFDIVFSMHCLEQIAYDCTAALREMYRICRYRLVMIEPVFENGDLLQKSYILLSDHTRVLLRSLHELGMKIKINKICEVQTNLVNQSSLLVVEKQ